MDAIFKSSRFTNYTLDHSTTKLFINLVHMTTNRNHQARLRFYAFSHFSMIGKRTNIMVIKKSLTMTTYLSTSPHSIVNTIQKNFVFY